MREIRWVIQNNNIAENELGQIQQTCKEIGVEYQEVLVIPFSPDLSDITLDHKTNIYYGSTTLMYNVYHKLNQPIGLFFDDKRFSMENYMSIWKDHMLNAEGKITTFKEFSNEDISDDELFFIRPDADDKSFAGGVKSFKEIKDWSCSFQKFDNVILTEDTKILVSTPWNINKEWRNYIVDGNVVATSTYRKDFRPYKSNTDVPAEMLKFVEDRCKEYMPHKNFAMDIALCNGEYFIIECGCINSVGFYAANIGNIVKALTKSVQND